MLAPTALTMRPCGTLPKNLATSDSMSLFQPGVHAVRAVSGLSDLRAMVGRERRFRSANGNELSSSVGRPSPIEGRLKEAQ